jgi:hypothetical protein
MHLSKEVLDLAREVYSFMNQCCAVLYSHEEPLVLKNESDYGSSSDFDSSSNNQHGFRSGSR